MGETKRVPMASCWLADKPLRRGSFVVEDAPRWWLAAGTTCCVAGAKEFAGRDKAPREVEPMIERPK